MKPMKIGITCFPTFGGSGIIATEIGLSLARRGHEVHFVCTAMPWRLQDVAPNVHFHAVEQLQYPLFDHSPYTLALTSKLVAVATAVQLDLLHMHYAIPHAASAYLARQILGARAPKIVTTLHGTDITVVGSDPSFLPITRFAIEQSDGVTVPSEDLKRDTYALLGVDAHKPIEVIPNFVDTEIYRPSTRDPQRLPTVVHNSNFRPLKRVDDVVRVFAKVRQARDCRLVLIGDGPERARVEQLVHALELDDDVRFLGEQLHVAPILRECDVFLLPSVTESFGLAALEALASGVPVVATRAGGLPEVVHDGENGLLAAVGDVETMAAAVLRLLSDGPLHARMAAAARAGAEAHYRRDPLVAKYEDYYRRVLG